MLTIVLMAVSWWVGRNWDMVLQKFNEKVLPAVKNATKSSGKATKID